MMTTACVYVAHAHCSPPHSHETTVYVYMQYMLTVAAAAALSHTAVCPATTQARCSLQRMLMSQFEWCISSIYMRSTKGMVLV